MKQQLQRPAHSTRTPSLYPLSYCYLRLSVEFVSSDSPSVYLRESSMCGESEKTSQVILIFLLTIYRSCSKTNPFDHIYLCTSWGCLTNKKKKKEGMLISYTSCDPANVAMRYTTDLNCCRGLKDKVPLSKVLHGIELVCVHGCGLFGAPKQSLNFLCPKFNSFFLNPFEPFLKLLLYWQLF